MLINLLLCITTSAPTLQLFAFNSSEDEMCQQEPSASVAIPPLFIAHNVCLFDAMSLTGSLPFQGAGCSLRLMAASRSTIEPMDLTNMRQNGVRSLAVQCHQC